MTTLGTIILSFVIGIGIGNMLGLKTAEMQAIKNNAAEYQIDKTTGEVKFVWLTNK